MLSEFMKYGQASDLDLLHGLATDKSIDYDEATIHKLYDIYFELEAVFFFLDGRFAEPVSTGVAGREFFSVF